MQRTVLLNPGPVNVSERVVAALQKGDLCHREAEFSRLQNSIRQKLLAAFAAEPDFAAVLISGSGTAALEMAVASCLSPGRSLLIIANGVYGERIGQIAECHHLGKHLLRYPWGRPPDLQEIETALRQHPEIEVVALVHHETTTGLLNPVDDIGRLTRRYGKKFLVDCISSLAGETLDLNQTNMDFCVGTANKCIQGLPGASFVLFRATEYDRLAGIPPRSHYLNLAAHHQAQLRGETLFTPAVQVFYALEEALAELLEETVAARIHRYRGAAERLRKGFRDMGLKFLIPREFHSNTLTALQLPGSIAYANLHDKLKEEGYVIYAGQGSLSQTIFRVANMGDIRPAEFERFLLVLGKYFSGAHLKQNTL